MKDNTVPGVYLLNIDMGCEQAKEEFKRMGFTDGEKLDFSFSAIRQERKKGLRI
ncbi:hypothetical protein [Bacteroides fragilis]|uniref:hypothetical protein n=1 Tax=Bacteroides fragilis TaxID=817 RepID=UPI00158CFEFA|nr:MULTISPECIES: hypothetical protein [Bacteroides]